MSRRTLREVEEQTGMTGDEIVESIEEDLMAAEAMVKHLRGLLREALPYVESGGHGDPISIQRTSLAERIQRLFPPHARSK